MKEWCKGDVDVLMLTSANGIQVAHMRKARVDGRQVGDHVRVIDVSGELWSLHRADGHLRMDGEVWSNEPDRDPCGVHGLYVSGEDSKCAHECNGGRPDSV